MFSRAADTQSLAAATEEGDRTSLRHVPYALSGNFLAQAALLTARIWLQLENSWKKLRFAAEQLDHIAIAGTLPIPRSEKRPLLPASNALSKPMFPPAAFALLFFVFAFLTDILARSSAASPSLLSTLIA